MLCSYTHLDRLKFAAIVLLTMALSPMSVLADEPSPDKSGYTLFNPTPRELMRDLSADRPDATESPITVDAGHLQVELSFFDYNRNDHGGEQTTTVTVADTNLRIGMSNNTELQLIFGLFTDEDVDVRGGSDSSTRGFSDLTLRYKINFWVGHTSGSRWVA